MDIVDDFMADPLPDWAIGTIDGKYVTGAQLPTRDGRKLGNAHIIYASHHEVYIVLTDAGTYLTLEKDELDELFHPPMYVSDVEQVRRKFGR